MANPAKVRKKYLTRDRDIRPALLARLIKTYVHSSQDLALQEFDCNSARVDIAIVNGAMHGFEIKSDSDSLYRLKAQLAAYEGVFDLITLVVGRRLLPLVEAELPAYCGLLVAERAGETIKFTRRKRAKKNPNQRCYDLARLLWKDEALSLLKRCGKTSVNSRSSAYSIWAAAAAAFDIDTLSTEVRLAIKLRCSSVVDPQSSLDDDSSTTESIALPDHYSENLAQLLSVLSLDRPD